MKDRTILTTLAFIIIVISLTSFIGWFAVGDDVIGRFLPNGPTLKFITSCLFLLVGIEFYSLIKIVIDKKEAFVPVLLFTSILSACIVLVCIVISINPNMSYLIDFLPKSTESDIWSRIPNMPPPGAIVIFFLVTIGNFALFFNPRHIEKILPAAAIVLFLIGFFAVVGTIFELSFFFTLTKHSGGISLTGAVLAVLMGLFLYKLSPVLKNSNS